ncbi:hypothetical protein [Staphylococcus arlettae]|uniref:hypothetical protein n=1 Tax=Staphylococcus arlettae TaxID=29378 RepID=UPI0021D129FB|nr:hypothetical protein [Staphylococcus arlettae]UXU51194.1 hypothetical protein MUA37_13130 [Staphylococcus arlettae]
MDIIIKILVGIIIGVGLNYWLLPLTKTNIILGMITGTLGSFIGTIILSSYSSISGVILTAIIGSFCLTLLVFFSFKTAKDLMNN